jgi:hypothetical protein
MHRTVLLCAILLLAASAARATDIGVTGQTLVISDKRAASGKSKVVFKIKDAAVAKGADGNPALLNATLDIFYTDRPCKFARLRTILTGGRRAVGAGAVGGGLRST